MEFTVYKATVLDSATVEHLVYNSNSLSGRFHLQSFAELFSQTPPCHKETNEKQPNAF